MTPQHASARAARRLAWMAPLAVLAAFGLVRLLLSAGPTSRSLGTLTARMLADRTRSSVQLSGVRFDWSFAPCFEDFVLYRYHGPVRVKLGTPEACVRDWAAALGSGLHAVRIELEAPSIELQGDAEPSARVVLARPEGDTPGAPGTPEASREQSPLLREIVLAFDDLRFDWDGLPLPVRLASGTFGPIDGQFILQERAGQVAVVIELIEPTSGTALSGRVAPSASGWDLAAGIEGDVVAVFGHLLASERIRLRRMPTRGRLGARFKPAEGRLVLDLDLEQHDLDFESELLAGSRLVGFSARERGVLTVDLGSRSLFTQGGLVELNGIPIEIDLELEPGEAEPRFHLQVRLRSTPFAHLLVSLPGTETLELARAMAPEIRFFAELQMTGAPTRPASWALDLEYRFEGLEAGPTGLERLLGPFEHHPLTVEGRASHAVTTGPGTPTWRPYDSLPYILRRAIIVSEDATFPFHRGIETEEVKHALEATLETGERLRGGSTISQQLAKNLFLTPDRTALRKVREALLAFLLEAALDKRRIFELYVNVIEWGPGIHGIGPAADHYFGVEHPADLTVRQMAYLASIIPAPTRYHRHHALGREPPVHRAKVDALLDRLHRLGQLDDQLWREAKEERLRFAPETWKSEDLEAEQTP